MNDEKENTASKKVATNKVAPSSRVNRLLYNPARRMGLNYPMDNHEDDSKDSEEIEEENTDAEDEVQETEQNDDEKEQQAPNPSRSQAVMEGKTAVSPFTFLKLKHKIIIILVIVLIFLMMLILFALFGASSADAGNYNSFCGGSGGDVVSFIAGWECGGSIDSCPHTCTIDGQDGWQTYDLQDNAISIGPGMTNWAVNDKADVSAYIEKNGWGKYFVKSGSTYNLAFGLCIPKEVIKKLQLYVLQTQFGKAVEEAMAKYDVELTQYQKDALTSLGYTHGAYRYTDQLVKAYKDGGYTGLWDVMKYCIKAGYESGFQKRTKGEFALFVTGDYSDQGKFYSRVVTNYDDYNSENVMSRLLSCNGGGTGDFYAPLSNGFTCSEGFHLRTNHPVYHDVREHQGLDLGSKPLGSPVYAVMGGKITKAEGKYNCTITPGGNCNIPSCGNEVDILHPDGTRTTYCHLLHNSVIVSVGDEVRGGQQIASVGSTGSSTGPHLHLSVITAKGEFIDPYDYFYDYWQDLYKKGVLRGDMKKCE